MNNLYANQWLERTCPLCGACFLPPDLNVWTYKVERGGKTKKRIYYCSYHCYRIATQGCDNEKAKRQRLGKKCKLTEADLTTMHNMMVNGATPANCAKYFSLDLHTIKRYLEKRREQFADVWKYQEYIED